MEKLDIIIFGASGFTGKRSALEMYKQSKEFPNLTWGIAGRNNSKLNDVLVWLTSKTNGTFRDVPIINADISDEASIKRMTSQCKMLINCCGPYDLYGEPVIKACISTGTHYVDITAETQFVRRIHLLYDRVAEEKGVYIVNACGLESIPSDLGVTYLQDNFKGTVNSVKALLSFWTDLGAFVYPQAHYGTYASLINLFANKNEIKRSQKPLEEQLDLQPKLESRFFHKDETTRKWCLKVPGCDRDMVLRTQRFFYEKVNRRPVQFQFYMAFPFILLALVSIILNFILFIFAQTEITRNFALKYPKLFTFGMLSHEGPSEENMEKSRYCATLKAEGWSSNIREENLQKTPMNKEMIIRFKTRNPGYGFTSLALVLSAISIITETKNIPIRGGVLSPAVVLHKTSFLQQLIKHELVELKTISDK